MAKEADSPNGLSLQAKPTVARTNKRLLWVVIIALLIMIAALVYGVNFASSDKKEEEVAELRMDDSKRLYDLDDRQGLLTQPPSREAPPAGVLGPPRQEPTVIVQHSTGEQERIDQEKLERERRRAQAFYTALSSPLIAKRVSSSEGGQEIQVSAQATPGGQSSSMPSSSEYDPAADKDKEQFFERARKDTDWVLASQRTEGRPLELKTGAVVPGVMVTGINSDLPGNMIAQVTQNVFDSATGRNLLIPQGTKIYGVYDSRVIYGQSRVLIAWNRLIFPDGSSMDINAMPGTDMGGMAGFKDEVDNHYTRIFGSALMMSLVTGSMAYALDSTNDGTSSENGTSMTDEMTAALAAQLGQTTTTLLQKNLNIKPTLEIRPGYQFNIVVTKDLVFRDPYKHWRK